MADIFSDIEVDDAAEIEGIEFDEKLIKEEDEEDELEVWEDDYARYQYEMTIYDNLEKVLSNPNYPSEVSSSFLEINDYDTHEAGIDKARRFYK